MASRRGILKAAVSTGVMMAAAPKSFASVLAWGAANLSSKHPSSKPLRALPLGEIRPAGWLLRQLRIQAEGLGGHLDEFWPDVGPNSGWLGGSGESWERGPYFVDGLLPLAWLLDDENLKAKSMRFIEWTLTHQAANGMIGPTGNDDWWPRIVMLKVLMQYHDATQDPRVIPVLTRYFHFQLQSLPARPLRDWGKYRWQDESLVVGWLYQKTGDRKLLALNDLLQGQGFDWAANYANFKYTGTTTKEVLSSTEIGGNKEQGMQTHGVNNGMGLKTAAVRYRFSGDSSERAKYEQGVAMLWQYHGMPNGMFSCDEHLAGLNPNHGTELCTVVETMFSMEIALESFGDAGIADQIEKIAYNALPGTFTDDMWAHQYDQQSNQIQSSLNSKPWTTNGPESNLFGLEPHFGCCTANFHQGWPKFAASLWMKSSDGGLVAAMYAPCDIQTEVRGEPVHLRVETDYPFRGKIQVSILKGDQSFPLHLRIPAWAPTASVHVNDVAVKAAVVSGEFVKVERPWKAGDQISLELPMQPRVSRWFHNAVAVERGPLLFSLSPGESWVKLRDRGPTADWQVFPRSAWNYTLVVDEASAANLQVSESAVPSKPFSGEEAAVKIQVPARRLMNWRCEDGVADTLPLSPVSSKAATEVVTLIPYAAAKLRVTAFPQTS